MRIMILYSRSYNQALGRLMKEENNLQGKTSRLLYFMSELEKGHKVNKTEYLKRFNIAERTFKDDLRELKENLKILRDDMKIKYSRLAGTYEAEYNHGYGNRPSSCLRFF